MIINLPYPRINKAWNFRLLIIVSSVVLFGVVFNFKPVSGSMAEPASLHTELPAQQAGELSVLTYNIAGLPELISSAKSPRASSIRTIGDRINAFDIVNIQEDFHYNAELFEKNTHSFRTKPMNGIPFGDGLNTLSKFPIVQTKRIAWNDCSGADCFAQKGFSYTRIQLAKEVFLDVYNIHATSQNNPKAITMRKRNLEQFADFLNKHSACQALLIMGDFNAHYGFSRDHVRNFKQKTSLFDSWVLLCNKGMIPEALENFQSKHALTVTDANESIDKIYYRNSDQLMLHPLEYQVQKDLFVNEFGDPLSDHCAISLNLAWELVDSN